MCVLVGGREGERSIDRAYTIEGRRSVTQEKQHHCDTYLTGMT